MPCCVCELITEPVEVYRLTDKPDCIRNWERIGDADIEMQPMGDKDISLVDGGSFHEVFKAYANLSEPIEETDKLRISTGCNCGIFAVSRVISYCGQPCPTCVDPLACNINHKKIILRRINKHADTEII